MIMRYLDPGCSRFVLRALGFGLRFRSLGLEFRSWGQQVHRNLQGCIESVPINVVSQKLIATSNTSTQKICHNESAEGTTYR